MNVEVFSMESLRRANTFADKDYEREHVTPYIYKNPDLFKVCQSHIDYDFSDIRLTVDEEEDFQVVKKVIELLYKDNKFFTLDDIVTLYEKNREIFTDSTLFVL